VALLAPQFWPIPSQQALGWWQVVSCRSINKARWQQPDAHRKLICCQLPRPARFFFFSEQVWLNFANTYSQPSNSGLCLNILCFFPLWDENDPQMGLGRLGLHWSHRGRWTMHCRAPRSFNLWDTARFFPFCPCHCDWFRMILLSNIYIYININFYVYIYPSIHPSIHTYIHTYVRTYIHTYIHIYIYIYVHIWESLNLQGPRSHVFADCAGALRDVLQIFSCWSLSFFFPAPFPRFDGRAPQVSFGQLAKCWTGQWNARVGSLESLPCCEKQVILQKWQWWECSWDMSLAALLALWFRTWFHRALFATFFLGWWMLSMARMVTADVDGCASS